jgi:hypothetical protein
MIPIRRLRVLVVAGCGTFVACASGRWPKLSEGGRYEVHNPTVCRAQVYTATDNNVTHDFQGATTNPEGGFSISGDGKYVAWDTIDQITDTKVSPIWHVYRTKVETLESELITLDRWCQPIPEMHDQMYSAISGDGRHVVFNSMWHVMYDDDFDWSRHLYLWSDPSPAPGPVGDLNGDGVVDVSDLLILLGSWGPCP